MREDLKHALIHCVHADGFWDAARAWFQITLPRLNPATWARDILSDQRITDKDRPIIITIMWNIWHSRNRVKHDGEALDPVTTARRTRKVMAILELPRKEPVVLPGHGWRPPEQGVIKISTDGALNFEEGRG